MGTDPRLVTFVFKSALVACLALIGLCLWLTTGVTPAAGSDIIGYGTDDLPAETDVLTDSAVIAGQTGLSDSEDGECPLSIAYPESVRRWCVPIIEFAAEYELPAELIAAVILQESGGDPLAYSSSGAVGLMQIMPRDGLAANFMCQNGPCFASRPTIVELQDPDYNLEFGVRMLAGLLDRTGDLRDAVKAYGPMDVGHTYADIVLAIYENYR